MRVHRRIAIALLLAGCAAAGPVPTSPSSPSPGPNPSATARPTSSPWLTNAAQAIQDEAVAHHADYCGRYLNSGIRDDLPQGAFVSMWRGNLATHEAAIRSRTDGTEPLAFIGCTFASEDRTCSRCRTAS